MNKSQHSDKGGILLKGKTTNALMKHLREKHELEIKGGKHKRELLNMGYYHGYKGYRFIRNANNGISYSKFDEVSAVYEFDKELKALLYPHIMFIETAIKNHTLEALINQGSVDFEYIFSNFLDNHRRHKPSTKEYHNEMRGRLKLRDQIYLAISQNYNKPVIKHFYQHNKPIPLWAIFEVISLGTFGHFYSHLNESTKVEVNKVLRTHGASRNQNGQILKHVIFLIKDLRNSVAHNSVIFDCRFKQANVSSTLAKFLEQETTINDIDFKTISDYFIVVIFLLRKFEVPKTDLKRISRRLCELVENLRKEIPVGEYMSIIGSDFRNKIKYLERYISS